MGVVVHIDKFSGPMALLLHLVRREEMDIFDININEITKQYLESIKVMKKLNLEVAGDFIAMAATLIQIKSKMLLPQYNEQGEIVEQEDPRKDLVRRLIEYQMYQEAGQNLYKRELVGRDVWLRGSREEVNPDESEIVIEEENALFALISCYRSAMKNMKKAVHKVAHSLQSIADRIWQMRSLLVVERPTKLSELVAHLNEGETPEMVTDRKGRLLITFLSLLELAKIGLVNLFQSENFADVHVETKAAIDRDAISKVENYESQVHNNPAQIDMMFAEPQLDFDEPQDEGAALAESVESVNGEIGQAGLELVESQNLSAEVQEVLGRQAFAPDEIRVESATDEEIEAALKEDTAGEVIAQSHNNSDEVVENG